MADWPLKVADTLHSLRYGRPHGQMVSRRLTAGAMSACTDIDIIKLGSIQWFTNAL